MDSILEAKINTLLEKMDKIEKERCQSEETKDIISDLIKAQGEFPKLIKNKKGQRGEYADLTGVIETVRPSLNKNNLYIRQHEDICGNDIVLVTTVHHKTGQWICSRHVLTPKKDIAKNNAMSSDQAYGSQLTYQKRYSICMILGISGDDTDPDEADDEEIKKQPSIMSAAQIESIERGLVGFPKLKEKLLKKCKSNDGTFKRAFAFLFDEFVADIKKQHAIGKDHE